MIFAKGGIFTEVFKNTMEKLTRDEKLMRFVLQKSKLCFKHGDVPIAAAVICGGEIVAWAYNRREADFDPTAHAEILALKRAGKRLKRWNLSDCELFVTIEPCAMCAGAIVNSRIKRLVFGGYDRRFGCCGSLMNICADSGLNHDLIVEGGVLEKECGDAVSGFFRKLRAEKKAYK